MAKPWHLDDYQRAFEAEVAAAVEQVGALQAEQLVQRALNEALPQVADMLYDALAKRSKGMLREHRTLRRGFVTRNVKRWREGFDLLERLIVISQETGSAINDALRPRAVAQNDALFEAIISNHARAVQVSREILTLMIEGFPDGALARWRTLHELAVVSAFVSQAGGEVAERYILHEDVTTYKRARNYMEHHERANLEPIDPEVMRELEAAHSAVIGRFGDVMKQEYGWASSAMHDHPKPTFFDLEKATGLDHWRPRYKWACINTHGSYRSLGSTLGSSEAKEPVLAVGVSNSGMTDPAQMTAISLCVATMPVINLEPNLDRLAVALIMQRLSDEVAETFWRLDRVSYEREMERRKRH